MTGVVAVVAVVGVVVGPLGVGAKTVVVTGVLGVALSTAQFVFAPTPLQCQCSHM